MRLLDPRSSHWAIRHIYVVMALVGLVMLALVYPISYLANDFLRDESIGLWFTLLYFGLAAGLIFLSAILAMGYLLIRRGVRFKSLKLQGANVD